MVTGKLGAGALGPRRRLQALCVKGSGMENLEARLAEGSPQPCCLRLFFPSRRSGKLARHNYIHEIDWSKTIKKAC